MQLRNAKQIIERYLSGTSTDEERAWVEDWYNQQSANSSGKSFSEEGLNSSALKMWPAIQPNENPMGVHDLEQDTQAREFQGEIPHRNIIQLSKNRKWWWAAAAIFIFGIGSLLWMIRTVPGSIDSAEMILAGGNRASLTLADGRTIDLSDDQNGIVIGEDDINYNDGSFVIVSLKNNIRGIKNKI